MKQTLQKAGNKTKATLFTVLVFLSLVSNNTFGQKFNLKKYLVPAGAMFASGMLDGTIETISFHYEDFKKRFPRANNAFWDPAISWKNKYKNYNPAMGEKFSGSTTALVFLTDGYHLLRTGKRTIETAGFVSYFNSERKDNTPFKKSWKKNAIDFLVFTAIRCVGFNLTYSCMFRHHSDVSFQVKL